MSSLNDFDNKNGDFADFADFRHRVISLSA
jgi:hypothetical protein